jgi:hypothetical protein
MWVEQLSQVFWLILSKDIYRYCTTYRLFYKLLCVVVSCKGWCFWFASIREPALNPTRSGVKLTVAFVVHLGSSSRWWHDNANWAATRSFYMHSNSLAFRFRKVIPFQAVKACRGEDVSFHSFLTSALAGCE